MSSIKLDDELSEDQHLHTVVMTKLKLVSLWVTLSHLIYSRPPDLLRVGLLWACVPLINSGHWFTQGPLVYSVMWFTHSPLGLIQGPMGLIQGPLGLIQGSLV